MLMVFLFSQIASHLELNSQSARVFVRSIDPASQVATTVTVSIDYTKPSLNSTSSLEERLSLLPSSDVLGGIPVDSNGTFGYQGFYRSGK